MPVATDDVKALPDAETIVKACKIEVLDKTGAKVTFGSLIDEKTVVVFIRHFWCGICQLYVKELAQVSANSLSAAGTRIIVIGCGDWQPIAGYIEETGFKGAIYANPNRELYHLFGLIENLAGPQAGEARPSYVHGHSAFGNAVMSTLRALKKVNLFGKQGNIAQLGGDFVFGPGQTCSFASRMRHTEDHVEVNDLMAAAGVAVPTI